MKHVPVPGSGEKQQTTKTVAEKEKREEKELHCREQWSL